MALPGGGSQSLEDSDFKALRKMLPGELLPGQMLGQEELSTRVGIGRTPLRNALEAHDADRAEQGMLKHLRTTIALMTQRPASWRAEFGRLPDRSGRHVVRANERKPFTKGEKPYVWTQNRNT